MRTRVFACAAFALLLLTSGTLAAAPAGEAVEVRPAATSDIEGAVATMSSGDDIFIGQRVVTGNDGNVQIVFHDDTHLVVGPVSTLVISEYLVRNDRSASKFVIDALGGTFRFVTGNSPKSAYEIKTPTGTIGVRGTRFDFEVDRQTGETWVVLFHGAVNMCAYGAGCTVMKQACGLGRIPERQQAEVVPNADPRQLGVRSEFPYIAKQTPLRRDFRIANSQKCKVPPKPTAAEIKAEKPQCPTGYSGTYPDCVPPSCPVNTEGTYPDCDPVECPDYTTGTYPECEPIQCPEYTTGSYPNCEPIQCPEYTTGTYPDCEPIQCPEYTTGTYPNCEPIQCPEYTTGSYPNCEPIQCPENTTGSYPNCEPVECPPGQIGSPPYCEDPPPETCPPGQIGSPPYCEDPPPETCPPGQVSSPPYCEEPPPETCPSGQVGTPPNCSEPPPETCPPGKVGTPPDCHRPPHDEDDENDDDDDDDHHHGHGHGHGGHGNGHGGFGGGGFGGGGFGGGGSGSRFGRN